MPRIDTLKSNTAKVAKDALAAGQLNNTDYKRLTDGTVSKTDLAKAKKVLTDAKEALKTLVAEDAGARRLTTAEKRVETAKALEKAVSAQFKAQEPAAPSRPSTGSGKGGSVPARPSRPSTGTGKGGSVPARPSRPSTGSGKGGSVPARPSRPATGTGKGGSVPARPSRPSTGTGKGGAVPARPSRPSVGTGKGTPR